ncbi:MAG: ABC transporter ATP-binding protein [Bacteroidetes bacterium]|nr:ABC transporter ATP-binding protein [Bacteroidota bacterium]
MKPAIDIQHLGKTYTLQASTPYMSLRDALTGSVKNIFQSEKRNKEQYHALDDINLVVQPGERVGIIGRNGAGKSTLLKIISRITPPTTGKAIIRGRVGSLLEVGTGFHPELTGRENIYLNGSILGLKKAEIKKQEAAIIEFSGVEKFINTPLKHYSTGMELRLAFSVAAHLEPEILLIDEVLAVGDIEFQQKCIGKMEEVSKSHGRTILFVTHNMDSLRKFCPQTMLLDKGKLIALGATEQVIAQYVSKHLQTNATMEWENGVASPNRDVLLHRAILHDDNGVSRSRYDTTEKVGISMEYEVLSEQVRFTHGINVYNQENVNIFNAHDVQPDHHPLKKKGKYKATAWIPGHLLPEGIFSISLALFLPNPVDILIHEQKALSFEMYTDFAKLTARGQYAADFPGVIRPLLQWELSSH